MTESTKTPGATWLSLLGATWLSRLGATWLFVAVLAGSLLATSLAPASLDDGTAATTEVGTLGVSSVDMLTNDDGSTPVSLTELRNAVLDGNVGATGAGIDVALIDTGVAPVAGLDNVIHGPDLSFEGTTPEVAYIDTFGHGTHMAGIIAGTRTGADTGVAPGARIVSVKVAGHDGVTTVPQVVAAIDWVVEHRNTDGLNIRVLNLSLGQSGVVSHVGDPLSAAVERAWAAGIFVVVAAGNSGDIVTGLDSPAVDPYVLAVGAADLLSSNRRTMMTVPAWSATGNGIRNVDITTGGRSIASYRVPGSTIDVANPAGRVGTDLFKGSGTSQAAAALSGSAAIMLEANPQLSPDDLKKTFTSSADNLRNVGEITAGKGLVDTASSLAKPKEHIQTFVPASGLGTGLLAPTGATWSGGTWSGATWSGATWSGATWSGGTWSGATWSGATWSGATWSGATWSGATWSGATWSGATWSGATWSGATWSGTSWI